MIEDDRETPADRKRKEGHHQSAKSAKRARISASVCRQIGEGNGGDQDDPPTPGVHPDPLDKLRTIQVEPKSEKSAVNFKESAKRDKIKNVHRVQTVKGRVFSQKSLNSEKGSSNK